MKPAQSIVLFTLSLAALGCAVSSSYAKEKWEAMHKPAAVEAPQIAAPHVPPAESTGNYVDSTGDSHLWRIDEDHALYWEGKPYEPIGAVLSSHFLSGDPTDENLRADVAALQAFKRSGVQNILVRPTGAPGCLLTLSPSAAQGFFDVLESMGFSYGLDLSGAPATSWNAILTETSIFRSPNPTPGAIVTFRNLPDVQQANYYLVTTTPPAIVASGQAKVVDNETVSVQLPKNAGGEGTVLIIFPVSKISPSSSPELRIPDFWTNIDDYRDSLLLYLGRLKFGRGLHFFVDPLKMDSKLVGLTQNSIVPMSESFRLQFQAFLENRYNGSMFRLRTDWGVKNLDVPDFASASRCHPLWYQTKGLPFMADLGTEKLYEMLPGNSKMWQDIHDFELDAYQNSMCDLACALKKSVADVPILYTWTSLSPVFVNHFTVGYDGLLAASSDHGDSVTQGGLSFAFGAAEEAKRTQWLVGQLDAPIDKETGNVEPSGRGVLTADRLSAESVGVKGLFIASDQKKEWGESLSSCLDWIHSDDASRTVEADSFATSKPLVLFYPLNAPPHGAAVQQVSPNMWWLPTFRDGSALDLGPHLAGYSLKNETGLNNFVIWSISQTAPEEPFKFKFPGITEPTLNKVDGTALQVHSHKSITEIPFGPAPLVVTGVDDVPLPVGTVNEEYTEIGRYVKQAQAAHIPINSLMAHLSYIRNAVMTSPDVDEKPVYEMEKDTLTQIKNTLAPYIWIEGETPSQQSFGSIVWSPDASGNAFLWVDAQDAPPGGAYDSYHAVYTVNVDAPGEYTIWASIAPGVPGSADASPIIVQTDNDPPVDLLHPPVSGDSYGALPFPGSTPGNAFTWCNLGSAQFIAGPHRITITVSAKSPKSSRYTLGIDALMLSLTGVKPNGAAKPSF